MISYQTVGPINGEFMVGYQTPGSPQVFTVSTICRTSSGAQTEQDRLNSEQEQRELALIRERELCGIYFDGSQKHDR